MRLQTGAKSLRPRRQTDNRRPRASLTRDACPDRGELGEGIGILVERMCNASVPIAAVAGFAIDLVQHGVQPIRGRIALVPLGGRVRGLREESRNRIGRRGGRMSETPTPTIETTAQRTAFAAPAATRWRAEPNSPVNLMHSICLYGVPNHYGVMVEGSELLTELP